MIRVESGLQISSKKTEDPTFLLQAIELIGGDIKKIPNVNWGSVKVLHNSIEKYYKATPKNMQRVRKRIPLIWH